MIDSSREIVLLSKSNLSNRRAETRTAGGVQKEAEK